MRERYPESSHPIPMRSWAICNNYECILFSVSWNYVVIDFDLKITPSGRRAWTWEMDQYKNKSKKCTAAVNIVPSTKVGIFTSSMGVVGAAKSCADLRNSDSTKTDSMTQLSFRLMWYTGPETFSWLLLPPCASPSSFWPQTSSGYNQLPWFFVLPPSPQNYQSCSKFPSNSPEVLRPWRWPTLMMPQNIAMSSDLALAVYVL